MIKNNFLIDRSSKIFVAGHKGLIGSAIITKLSKSGYSNLLIEDRSNLDLCDTKQTLRFLTDNKPDCMILAAGYTGGVLENKHYSHKLFDLNTRIELSALTAAYMAGTKKVIFFGSSCMYPKNCFQPMEEADLLNGSPDESSLSYALAKLVGLQICKSYNSLAGAQKFITLIPNTVYGPNDNFNPESGHVISALLNKFHKAQEYGLVEVTLWGSGKVKREFLFSEDLAEMCLLILEKNNDLECSVFNIGSGYEVSILNLSKKIAEIVGFKGKVKWDKTNLDGVDRKILSSKRSQKIGWKAKTPLSEGLIKTYEWFVKNG